MYALKPLFILFITLTVICLSEADNLTVGSSVNGQLVHMEHVSISAIPLKIRGKTVFYNGQLAIKGINAIDLDKSKARVIITAGGIGSTYVNMKLKSERGEGLNYQIQIFA